MYRHIINTVHLKTSTFYLPTLCWVKMPNSDLDPLQVSIWYLEQIYKKSVTVSFITFCKHPQSNKLLFILKLLTIVSSVRITFIFYIVSERKWNGTSYQEIEENTRNMNLANAVFANSFTIYESMAKDIRNDPHRLASEYRSFGMKAI